MSLFKMEELEAAATLVHAQMLPTPQYVWPLLSKRAGCNLWVKHENHTPVGAFKVRGGIVYMNGLKSDEDAVNGVITATRGNHGQSIARAGQQAGIGVTIVVPHGNSVEKNAAMQAFGAELIEHGRDFDEAKLEAARLAHERGLLMVPSFHMDLVTGVASYALELFRAVSDLDAVYVPIGMGSGICGLIGVRDLLGLKTDIVGVVSAAAPATALSFASQEIVKTDTALTFADGVACREPNAQAMEVIRSGAARIVQVSEDEIAAAVRILYTDTHNIAEGAGAAALAGLLQERSAMAGRRVGVILTGAGIDKDMFFEILSGKTPLITR